jgi:hypothetical protein
MVHFHPSPLKINGRRVELNLTRLWNIRILTPGFCAHWASAYSFIPLKSFKVRVLGENIKHVTSNGFKKPCQAWDGSRCGPDRIDGTYSRAMLIKFRHIPMKVTSATQQEIIRCGRSLTNRRGRRLIKRIGIKLQSQRLLANSAYGHLASE